MLPVCRGLFRTHVGAAHFSIRSPKEMGAIITLCAEKVIEHMNNQIPPSCSVQEYAKRSRENREAIQYVKDDLHAHIDEDAVGEVPPALVDYYLQQRLRADEAQKKR